MITREENLTIRGDCVAAVKAEKGLTDFEPEMVKAAQSMKANISLTLSADGKRFRITGKGHPKLTYKDPKDMVARKSGYVCNRTLMVNADKGARDIPRDLVKLLRSLNTEILVEVEIKP